jgi:hypothetical protein
MGTNLLILAALLAAVFAAHKFIKANPAAMARRLKIGGGIVALAAAAFLMSRGAAVLGLPLGLLGVWLLWEPSRLPGGTAPSQGQISSIVTDHLEVQLDHDSGEMTGRVRKGMFAERRIENMRAAELALLWQDCRFVDQQSAQILQAFLDRTHPSWQEDMARGEKEMSSGPNGKMTEKEALEILGLKTGASEDEVRKAHRELMMRLHPDRGGSTYLASKVNEAKAVLLAE